MRRRAYVLAPLLCGAAGLLAGVNAVYLVGQAQQAVLLHLGEATAAVNAGPSPSAAGLHLCLAAQDVISPSARRTSA